VCNLNFEVSRCESVPESDLSGRSARALPAGARRGPGSLRRSESPPAGPPGGLWCRAGLEMELRRDHPGGPGRAGQSLAGASESEAAARARPCQWHNLNVTGNGHEETLQEFEVGIFNVKLSFFSFKSLPARSLAAIPEGRQFHQALTVTHWHWHRRHHWHEMMRVFDMDMARLLWVNRA